MPSTSGGMINFYEKIPKDLLDKVDNPNEHLHQIKIPARICVVGPSGSGKTGWLLNLIYLFSQGKGTWSSITIITANDNEPLYKYLRKKMTKLRLSRDYRIPPSLTVLTKRKNHLVVWDDMVLAKDLSVVCNYYIRAKKQNVSCIFISQSYYHIPLMIRKNCNYLVLLKLQGTREINAILRECGLGFTREQLVAMYHYATDEKMSPLLIDFNEQPEKRFRKGFLEILNPDGFLQSVR